MSFELITFISIIYNFYLMHVCDFVMYFIFIEYSDSDLSVVETEFKPVTICGLKHEIYIKKCLIRISQMNFQWVKVNNDINNITWI